MYDRGIMRPERLTAFTDGVIAIIITIMVLELKAPREPTFAALLELSPIFLSYALSFVYVAIYWNNHHHLLHACKRVDGAILWANMHLLFWMSLIPFATAWMGENHFTTLPTAFYGIALFLPAIAYKILQEAIIHQHRSDGELARAIGNDFKGYASPVLYLVAIAGAFVDPWISQALYVVVALMWLRPDRRIEGMFHDKA